MFTEKRQEKPLGGCGDGTGGRYSLLVFYEVEYLERVVGGRKVLPPVPYY
jgi:hypothetical protein